MSAVSSLTIFYKNLSGAPALIALFSTPFGVGVYARLGY